MFSPNTMLGKAEVQLREYPKWIGAEDISLSGWIYHCVLEPGDSVAVTQHDAGDHSACTVFFYVQMDGSLKREEAPHGLTDRP